MRANRGDELSSRRTRRGPLLAGAGLIALVVLALGVWLGRATAPGDKTTRAPSESVGPGPAEVVKGVPVGYARTRDGAVAAAANYTAVLGSKQNMSPAFGAEAYRAFALPDVVDDLTDRAERFSESVDDAAALAANSAIALRAAPLGYRIDDYSSDAATITVWAVAMGVGTHEFPLSTSWGTEQLTLRWTDGDWKVAGIVGGDGPEPVGSTATVAEPDAAVRINAFEPFVYQPGGQH